MVNSDVSIHTAKKVASALSSGSFQISSYTIMRLVNEKLALPMKIPVETIVGWLKRGVKPKARPLLIENRKSLEYLAYVVAARLGDAVFTRDLAFAVCHALALHKITGQPIEVKKTEIVGYGNKKHKLFILPENSAIHYIIKSGLWKALAILCPKAFLKGLFDAEGGVGVWIHNNQLSSMRVVLYNTNLEVIEMAVYALKLLGFKNVHVYKTNRCYRVVLSDFDSVRRFNTIGFRETSRRWKYIFLKHLLNNIDSPKARYKIFTLYFKKLRNKRWIPKREVITIFSMLYAFGVQELCELDEE